jgi:DNA-binding response OmpR family regulator
MAVILIIEDEKEMIRGLKDLLEYEQHEIITALEGQSGLAKFEKHLPDLVILDMMLPDMDGMSVCSRIRKSHHLIPILVLSARGQEHDIVLALEAGADDYVKKPFSVAELVARINALLRRTQKPLEKEDTLRIGDKEVDPGRFILRNQEQEIPLTYYEVEILKLLFQNRKQCVSRETIYRKVWGMEGDPSNRTVDNFVAKIRKKIEMDHKHPKYLITVYGKGYKLLD